MVVYLVVSRLVIPYSSPFFFTVPFLEIFVNGSCGERGVCPRLNRVFRSYRGVEQGLARWAHNPKVGGSNPSPAIFYTAPSFGGIAQLVEQRNHNPCVVGSIPTAAILHHHPLVISSFVKQS